MDRKEFIKRSALFTAGAITLPNLLYGLGLPTIEWEGTFKGKVIIIGAGAAGIYAGYLLNELGIDFQILEASEKYGGRLAKNDEFADFPIDLGAEWLHGEKSVAGELARNNNHAYFVDDAKPAYCYKGERLEKIPRSYRRLSAGFVKTTLLGNTSEIAEVKGATQADQDFVEMWAGVHGASADNLYIGMENRCSFLWHSGHKDYRFQETYFDLIDKYLIPSISKRIILNSPVAKIDYKGTKIKVTDRNSNLYEADKVIVALPLSVLKDEDIQFEPTLPLYKVSSFNELGMEAGIKLYIKFSKKFYDDNLMGAKVCPLYVDESNGKSGNDNVLMCYLMGAKAREFSKIGEQEGVQAILSELDTIYDGKASESYQEHILKDWGKDPFIRGAYSYATKDTDLNTRKRTAKVVDNKIHFAGEFTNFGGHQKSVHGAMETGHREVQRILSWIDKNSSK